MFCIVWFSLLTCNDKKIISTKFLGVSILPACLYMTSHLNCNKFLFGFSILNVMLFYHIDSLVYLQFPSVPSSPSSSSTSSNPLISSVPQGSCLTSDNYNLNNNHHLPSLTLHESPPYTTAAATTVNTVCDSLPNNSTNNGSLHPSATTQLNNSPER